MPVNIVPDLRTEELLLNVGPQHPATHGVFKVVLKTDGELVMESESHLGFLHRCKEKIGENLSYVQFTPYTDRLDYISSMSDNYGYCLAVEKLYDNEADEKKRVTIPERAQYIRLIVTELQRIASHLLAVGTYGLDIGAITPFLHCFREREMILMLFERLCGQRLNYNYVRVGGVRFDLPQDWIEEAKRFCDWFGRKIDEYDALLSFNEIFIKRTGHVGVISEAQCRSYALTGPVVRGSALPGSDLDRDLRRDHPYGLYGELFNQGVFGVVTFDPEWAPVRSGDVEKGDCWSRYFVRVNEMRESLKLVQHALEHLPAQGEVHVPKLLKSIRPPKGEAYRAIENPRGELGFYVVSDGSMSALRMRIRSGSFVNISLLDELVVGHMLADVMAIIGSIDIVLGEVDR